MSVRLQIAVLVFTMVQSVLFGAGVILVLATPLTVYAMLLIPTVIIVSTLISVPVSWLIAPRLRARYWNPSPLLPPSAVRL